MDVHMFLIVHKVNYFSNSSSITTWHPIQTECKVFLLDNMPISQLFTLHNIDIFISIFKLQKLEICKLYLEKHWNNNHYCFNALMGHSLHFRTNVRFVKRVYQFHIDITTKNRILISHHHTINSSSKTPKCIRYLLR